MTILQKTNPSRDTSIKTKQAHCRVCDLPEVNMVLDFGPQALSNRFLIEDISNEYKQQLVMGICSKCGLIQSTSHVPADEMRPRFKWITYNEPEGHLDQIANDLAALPQITTNSNIVGLTYKEDTLLKRMQDKGFNNTHRFDMAT